MNDLTARGSSDVGEVKPALLTFLPVPFPLLSPVSRLRMTALLSLETELDFTCWALGLLEFVFEPLDVAERLPRFE